MTDITDKSLLRCTYKKSLHVFEKVVLYTAYAIDGLAAIVIGFYAALWAAAAMLPTGQWIVEQLYGVCNWVSSGLISLVSLVPWYVWVIIAVVLAIPVYSLLWCVSRELTEEDYSCDINLSDCAVVGILTAMILGGSIGMAINTYPNGIEYPILLIAGLIILGMLLLCPTQCKLFRVVNFYSAVYHHYIIAPKKTKQETFVEMKTP